MTIRDRVEQLERSGEIVRERLRTHVRTRSDFEIIAHLWRVPIDRIPADLLAMPKSDQIECLEKLRHEVSA
jgi:hypothetical protein